jgi:hypothetical protein
MAEQPAKKEKVVQLNVRLAPVNNSDQPVFANYSTVGVAQATAYLDFGFIEPAPSQSGPPMGEEPRNRSTANSWCG